MKIDILLQKEKKKVVHRGECGLGEKKKKKSSALTGNRTRASRVAGENSTTEPSVLHADNSVDIV